MTQELAALNNDLIFEPAHLTKETIKKHLCPEATDQELMLGLQIAKTFNLNPLKREVYFVKYKAGQPMQVLTGYEVYLKRAERSGKYNGLEITSQGSINTGDLKAIVKVFRKDWTNPLIHEAFYSEYVQMKKDFNTGVETPNKFWATKPITMIKKVAVSQAFRMAFPDEFDGMPYTSDEVIDQERVIDIGKPSETAQNSPTLPQVELKSSEQANLLDKPIGASEGNLLLKDIKSKGYTTEDLKQYISFEFNLGGLTQITGHHIPKIQAYFAKAKKVVK